VGARFIDVTLDNLGTAPPECLESVFWEISDESMCAPEDARFHKEEWFSSTLLEWGSCGKLGLSAAEDRSEAFAQYAPGPYFPRLADYRCGRVSDDAAYLSYCFVVGPERGAGLGSRLLRTVARDLVDRGYRAVEAIGDRDCRDGWVLPAPFLGANGFQVLREDPRFPLMRLDLRITVGASAGREAAAVPLPAED
jgi:GNAT superfamily N-acetyltransferase